MSKHASKYKTQLTSLHPASYNQLLSVYPCGVYSHSFFDKLHGSIEIEGSFLLSHVMRQSILFYDHIVSLKSRIFQTAAAAGGAAVTTTATGAAEAAEAGGIVVSR